MPQVELCTALLTQIVRTVASNEDAGIDEEHLDMFSRQFHTAYGTPASWHTLMTGSAIYTVLAGNAFYAMAKRNKRGTNLEQTE